MKFDLSSKITLEMIPDRYYRNDSTVEAIRQERFEKIRTKIYKDSNEGALFVAKKIAKLINEKKIKGEQCILGLSGGSSPLGVYEELVKMYNEKKIDFSHVIIFNISEFFPYRGDEIHSNTKVLRSYLIDHVNIKPENFHSPDATINKTNIYEFCRKYEELIEEYKGLDLILASVGLVGNIAYNEPGSQMTSRTRLMLLDSESQSDLVHFYASFSDVPDSAVTIGISEIMNAGEVIMVAWGEHKANIISKIIQGKVDENIPASYLQLHKNATAVIDLNAAQNLTRINQPWLVGSCQWDDKLIRRAIVWLCEVTKKPILKLTNKDYNQHGLDELLSLYGSAYDVNIKIFNSLQHTITGWPGGKPNADDTNRPERALPYPKKVLIFSPHPDDDVISMGGTLQRLVDQNHDVHVAYETSGNIAVGDDEVVRYVALLKNLNKSFNHKDPKIDEFTSQVLQFLLEKKKIGDLDTKDVLFIKGQIRREEARSACRFIGVNPQNVHFLDLPFYETGRIEKNKLSPKDVEKIIPLLQEIKPNQIYLAGDLADPHGTHKVALDAALAAIHELKDEEWVKQCRIWMYRGAWAEWSIDHIEMAVPMSPEQLRKKRNAILKHQSQMESAPFLGNDERLFWQRSEERNKTTAKLYQDLGLASYEAIEAFVEYKTR